MPKKSATNTANYKKPKWHLIYYVLAALDLIAVSLGIYLNNKITEIYNTSVEESATWANRTQSILNLSEIAISANAPGNQVFESGDVEKEKTQLLSSITKYKELSEKIRKELQRNLSLDNYNNLNEHLSEAKIALKDMENETYRIFSAIEKNDVVQAGRNMASMDADYYRVLQALTTANHIASDLQASFFAEQRALVKRTEQWRVYVAIAIVLMVIGITFYGRLLAKQIRETEEAHEFLENEIESSLLRTQAILDTTADAIITINSSGIIETFNKGAENIFQYTAEEAIGENVKILMPPPFSDEHDEYVKRYIKEGKAHIIGLEREVTAMRKDGEKFVAELSVAEILHHNKKIFTGTIRDITHRKQVENMKNEFVSTVSHELRTPLTAIHGVISLLESEVVGEQTDEAKEFLQKAIQNSEKLNQIVNDILDMQKIAAGKLDYNEESISIDELITTAISENQPYADKYSVTLESIKPDRDTIIFADRSRLLQVMTNLISNACKYSPKNARVEITTTREGKSVQVNITDYGSGIPDSFKKNIFQKFHQADSSDTRAKGGTGLGLSITRSIVEHHNGEIWFDSIPEKYTTFSFKLPINFSKDD